MKRLGHTEFVPQGGDRGATITDPMGRQGTSGTARHSFQHADVFRPDSDKVPFRAHRRRPVSPADEKVAYERSAFVSRRVSAAAIS